jgi:stress-induced morphogen
MKVLHMNFTKKVFMSQVFYQLRTTCRREKQFRQRKLNQFYKAWQNYIQYNRHLMQSNMASIAFRDSNKIYTIRAVFNALRQHTETKKHALLEHAVKFDMDVAIKDTKDFN